MEITRPARAERFARINQAARLMRSIAVINQKGGVGKTTTAVNVSAALARRGARVLLIDLDAQAHATLHVGVENGPGTTTVYDVLVRGAPMLDAMQTIPGGLVVVPSHIDLVGAEVELGDRSERESALLNALAGSREHFDYCIMDCAPSLGVVTINALAASDEVIIPLQPHFLALQGLGKLLDTVSLVRGVLQPTLRVSGVVLCMYESATRLAREVRADVSQFIRDAEYQDAWYGARVFATAIRKNIRLAECPSFGQTIFEYAPQSKGAADYAALAEEIAGMADVSGEATGAAASASSDSGAASGQPIEDEPAADGSEQSAPSAAEAEAESEVPADQCVRTAFGGGSAEAGDEGEPGSDDSPDEAGAANLGEGALDEGDDEIESWSTPRRMTAS